MDVKNLMVEDWVYIENDPTPRQIDWIKSGEVGLFWNKIVTPPHLKPIPITSEILEKNGFVHYEEDEESFHDEDCVFIKQNLGGYGACLDKIRTISGILHYVHELQHALKLCGIDKTIEL